jgi:hypothetical protein
MINIFDYATKELSQDAFLRWFFESYNSDNKKLANNLQTFLSAIVGKTIDVTKIRNLTTKAQWKYLDVVVEFVYEEKNYFIAIEDKIFSAEHNQLENYNKKIDDYPNGKKVELFRIFYKTSILSEEEKERVEKAKWTIFDLQKIYGIFSKFENTNNNIFDDYVQHINNLNDLCYNYKTKLFSDCIGKNIVFESYGKTELNELVKNNSLKGGGSPWQGRYVYYWITKTINNVTYELCFEFRDYRIRAILKCYEKDKPEIKFARKPEIKKLSDCFFKDKDWKLNNMRNNLLCVKEKSPDKFYTFNDFNDWVLERIEEYISFLKDIENKNV